MNPSSDGIRYSPFIARKPPQIQKIVTAFYKNLFAPSKEILTKIEKAVTKPS
jgi:hypothetical protein